MQTVILIWLQNHWSDNIGRMITAAHGLPGTHIIPLTAQRYANIRAPLSDR